MIPVYLVNPDFKLESLFNLPLSVTKHGWTSIACHNKVEFVIALSTTTLYFGAKVSEPPMFDPSPTGAFVNDLWQKDVLELFINDDSSLTYQEFNLSPSGAWWSGVFSEYRVSDSRNFKPLAGVHTIAQTTDSSWQAALSIERADLSVTTALGLNSSLNFSAIIGGTERQYLSWADLSGPKPDFHLRQEFERIQLVQG